MTRFTNNVLDSAVTKSVDLYKADDLPVRRVISGGDLRIDPAINATSLVELELATIDLGHILSDPSLGT